MFTDFLCYSTTDFPLYWNNSFLGLLYMFTDFLCYSTTHKGFGGFSSMLEQFFPGIMYVCSRIFYATVLHTGFGGFSPYTGRIPSRDYYVQDATLINIIEGCFFKGRFVPEDVLSRWTFSLKDVLSQGRFVPLDVLSQGHFVPLDLLSQGGFVPGCLVSGHFVYVPTLQVLASQMSLPPQRHFNTNVNMGSTLNWWYEDLSHARPIASADCSSWNLHLRLFLDLDLLLCLLTAGGGAAMGGLWRICPLYETLSFAFMSDNFSSHPA
jgi:hypothetical protein